ncbi:MAG: VWA domain-containing protein, partial [Eubacterium sp.]|nr:VWA domain-containing protein [Eubacterium sp.]
MKRWIKRENNRTAQGLLLMLVSLFLLCSTAVWCADFRANAEEVKEDERSIEGSADIVFVIDSTGSMYEYITSVKQNLTSFVQALNSRKVTLKMSVIEFRDIEVDGPDSTIYYEFDGSHWTSDADKVIRVFDSIQVDGGGDEPETPLDAFEKIK